MLKTKIMSKSATLLITILLIVLSLVAILFPASFVPLSAVTIVRVLGIISAIAAGWFLHKASQLPG